MSFWTCGRFYTAMLLFDDRHIPEATEEHPNLSVVLQSVQMC